MTVILISEEGKVTKLEERSFILVRVPGTKKCLHLSFLPFVHQRKIYEQRVKFFLHLYLYLLVVHVPFKFPVYTLYCMYMIPKRATRKWGQIHMPQWYHALYFFIFI